MTAARRAARDVVRPDVVAFVRAAIRQEIDRVAVPHRLCVVGRVRGDVLRRERLQIEQHQVGRPAAAIALPVAEVLRHRHVDELLAVGRVGAELAVRHRQLFGQAAVETDGEELAVALTPAFAARREQHAFAVGRPANHPIAPSGDRSAASAPRRSRRRHTRRRCRHTRRCKRSSMPSGEKRGNDSSPGDDVSRTALPPFLGTSQMSPA